MYMCTNVQVYRADGVNDDNAGYQIMCSGINKYIDVRLFGWIHKCEHMHMCWVNLCCVFIVLL